MSAGRCLDKAMAISLQPLERWAEEIALLPDACVLDCAAPRSCRQRNAEYLRVQYRVLKRRQDRDAAALKSRGTLL